MITNFFRIKIPSDRITIQRLAFSQERFEELKTAHNKDASFFRHGDFIYISPKKGSGLRLASPVSLSVPESSPIVLSLIRHLVFRSFRDSFPDRILEGFSPLRFFSNRRDHDAAWNLLPSDLREKIRFLRMIEVESRQIIEAGKPLFGLLIRSRQRWQINLNLSQIAQEGYDLKGVSVLEAHEIPGLQGVLAPDEMLLGEILSINNDDVSITTNDGVVKRKLSSLHLQRTRHQIGAYLAFKMGDPATNKFFSNLREQGHERSRPGFFFAEARKFAEWFIETNGKERVYENDDGFRFSVSRNNAFTGGSMDIHRTNLIFDYGPGASATSPFGGLSKFWAV